MTLSPSMVWKRGLLLAAARAAAVEAAADDLVAPEQRHLFRAAWTLVRRR